MSEVRECHYGHRDNCEKVADMQKVLKLLAHESCITSESGECLPCMAQEVLLKYGITWQPNAKVSGAASVSNATGEGRGIPRTLDPIVGSSSEATE